VFGTGGINCTTGKLVLGAATYNGGTNTGTDCETIVTQYAFLSGTNAATATRYYKLPVVAKGLAVGVINNSSVTQALYGNAGESFMGATSTVVATSNAANGSLFLVCDGTNWYRGAA